MSWTLPLSSSPLAPSVPGPSQRNQRQLPNSPSELPSDPSTTPAGPPPSSAASFTPAGPPPSSVFGSSQLGSGKTLFKSKSSNRRNSSQKNANPFSRNIDESKLARYLDKSGDLGLGNGNGTQLRNHMSLATSSSRIEAQGEEEASDGTQSDDYDTEEDEDDVQDEEEDDEINNDSNFHVILSPIKPALNGSITNGTPDLGSSILNSGLRGVKRPRGGASLPVASPRRTKRPAKPKHESAIPRIARSIAAQLGVADLNEPEDFILGTENILLQRLCESPSRYIREELGLAKSLANVSESLSNFWTATREQDLAKSRFREDVCLRIGPEETASFLHKAIFLGTLLLQLQHRPEARGKQALALTQLNQPKFSRTSNQAQQSSNPTAYPRVLADWLDRHHNPYQQTVIEVAKCQPSPTAHPNLWDMLFSLTLRGRIADVASILKKCNFQDARTAKADGSISGGYHGEQLRNIERVVSKAVQVLELCPTLLDDDWHVTGNGWEMFRKRMAQALEDLATFAEGRDRDLDPADVSFEASNFGLRSTTMGLSKSTRKAESRVPWTIYQNMKVIYGILLGGSTEILSQAQDWAEATIGLTMWWDGDDEEDMPFERLAVPKKSMRKSNARGPRLVTVNSGAAYSRRLAHSFQQVTDELEDDLFQINSLNSVEVGLACIFEGNVDGVLNLLQGWSLPVAAAVAEIGALGGWVPRSGFMDLMPDSTIDHDPDTPQATTTDSVLAQYADKLAEKDVLQGKEKSVAVEGWEVSVAVLNRIDDKTLANRLVTQLLNELSVESDERIAKVLAVCKEFELDECARRITESYADRIAEDTDDYGTALVWYARARRQKKMKDILDLLISLSLVQSIAFPPLPSLDPNLHALIFSPEDSLAQLEADDEDAAETLREQLTGYASLRRFYDLRDEEVNLEEGQRPRLSPIARQKAAATALLAVINSASDNIHGGLFDPNRGSVVPVDGLLALLGETMVFIDREFPIPASNKTVVTELFVRVELDSTLSPQQCFALLKAVEDIETVAPRVYAKCEEIFRATIRAYNGRGSPASPRELLKKTMSSMTSAGSFSLVGSSLLDSESIDTMSESRALVKSKEPQKRGWDWRAGLEKDAKGEDIIRVIRLRLAKDLAKHWIRDI